MSLEDFDRVAAKIDILKANGIAKRVNSIIKKLESRAIAHQSKLFPQMSQDIIGKDGPPRLAGISLPQMNWKPLSGFSDNFNKPYEPYIDKKWRVQNTSGQSFFLYKGKLKSYLDNIGNPIRNFGKPQVYFVEQGGRKLSKVTGTNKTVAGGVHEFGLLTPSGNISKSKTFIPNGNLGRIVVDLFPKIKNNFNTNIVAGDYFPKTIAYRIDNYQGGRDRYFLGQYFQWWVRVQSKQLLRGI